MALYAENLTVVCAQVALTEVIYHSAIELLILMLSLASTVNCN
jgi:hypothetical protein